MLGGFYLSFVLKKQKVDKLPKFKKKYNRQAMQIQGTVGFQLL